MGRHSAVLTKLAFLTAVLALVAAACGDDTGTASPTTTSLGPDGEVVEFSCPDVNSPAPELLEVGVVFEYSDNGNGHEACSSGYEMSPPASGDHFDAWQNCGFYTEPILDYGAVHALEHGAVWIAYQPDLTADEVNAIAAAVEGESHLLAAPYPGLENPIVLTAWTRQLAVDRWADPTVDEFLGNFVGRLSTTAPEAGVRCDGGFGSPPDQPLTDYQGILDQVR
ncbi:MAG: DUF3105 domain-containing protein [Acidimicrobiales bacterium]|nr:DUF3105 domain-containing protein [Acidimicrobiales bacterium]